MTVLLVSVGVVTDAVVVVGVTMVELVSVGETSVVPVAAIGAVSDVPLSVAVVSFADGAVPYADVSVPPVSVFSAASRLQPTQRATQRTTRINLRMEQLSFAERVRQKMGRAADPLALSLIAIAALRVVATLTVFSATTDEPLHVTCGLQLVQEGRYDFQLENPPLPRVVFAWPLHRAGGEFRSEMEPMEQMRAVFYSTGDYEQALFAARIGNLLFFLLAALATWRLARRELGPANGTLATLLFTTQPVILGTAAACLALFLVQAAGGRRQAVDRAGFSPPAARRLPPADWGQDMLRLRAVLREVNAPHLSMSMTGLHDFHRLGFPPSREIDPWVPATGGMAVSEHMFRMLEEKGGY